MRINPSPTEQSTAATDVALALLAFGYACDLFRQRKTAPQRVGLWSGALVGLGTSAALGSVAHGLDLSEATRNKIWKPLNLALGVTVALFVAGAIHDRFGAAPARKGLPWLLGLAGGFFAITLAIPGTFMVFLAYEAAALLAALGMYGDLAARQQLRGAGRIVAGVLLTIIAAAIQASPLKARLGAIELDNNGIFHLVQMLGLVPLANGIKADLSAN